MHNVLPSPLFPLPPPLSPLPHVLLPLPLPTPLTDAPHLSSFSWPPRFSLWKASISFVRALRSATFFLISKTAKYSA